MSDKKCRGIVLRETDYKESDRLLTVLTGNSGLITLKVRGIRKSRFLYRSACELLAWSEFTYRDYQGYNTLSEADCLEHFTSLRSDIVKLSLAMYFAQVSELVSQEDVPGSGILRLLLNSLYALSSTSQPVEKVKAAFEWRASILAGYEADLTSCSVCGNLRPNRLVVGQGIVECADCYSQEHEGIRMPIESSELDALRYLSISADKKMLSFSIECGDYQSLSDITEAYLLTQLEHGFSSLDLYKSLNYSLMEQSIDE